ncbi:MerR family transcriptional regulator [Flavobacterium sp. NRK F10]|uniref:MerR family transcriptional regulator n=1 Tax=Flavobacterium sp. NRK F10 TaxID=2954931 RepID=UPI002090C479|nr:MerR family transcriptional regulator [Flavobacterium sp. NRK F10]MCO6174156.1 MerR family transcriptional regulator [Flavobacterium sp. NRK F10]
MKDLENLSGIKAHTIRIWEKRYEIFTPDRNENNVRSYTSEELQKLLNIAFLNRFGYKISKIAQLNESQLVQLVQQTYSQKTSATLALSEFKLAMFNFDTELFHKAYNQLKEVKTFDAIFFDVFIPLLDEIGLLWQTATLKPVHEHFISSLVKQKLFFEMENLYLKVKDVKEDRLFVLFLPLNEIHELGLLFLQYQLLKRDYRVVFLGESVPVEDLQFMVDIHPNLVFVSYFTVQPSASEIDNYLSQFSDLVLKETSHELWVLGQQTQYISKLNAGIQQFMSIQELLHQV